MVSLVWGLVIYHRDHGLPEEKKNIYIYFLCLVDVVVLWTWIKLMGKARERCGLESWGLGV